MTEAKVRTRQQLLASNRGEAKTRGDVGFSGEKLGRAIPSMTGKKVLIIGDVMLDQYIFGSVDRISPEAPVPVVLVQHEEYRLGGAGNVARNVAALGGKCALMGYIGADAAGHRMREILGEHGIENKCIEETQRPTTTKTRIIAQQQQVVRIDRETCSCQGLHNRETLLAAIKQLASEYSVIIISDYGKGFVTKDFMHGLMEMRKAMESPPVILVDPKPKNYCAYAGVDLLTPNTKEAGIDGGETTPLQLIALAGHKLRRRLRTKRLLITLGSRGMMLFDENTDTLHIPTAAKTVYDVTGAGDTVIAVLGLAMAAGLSPLQGCLLANYAAGLVVGQVGAAVVSQHQLAEAIKTRPSLQLQRIEAVS